MMNVGKDATPVTVLRAAAHGPLGIVRSLGRMGVPVYVVECEPGAPAFFSRYCRGRFRCDIEGGSAEDGVEKLLEVGRAIGRRSILVPTTDDAALFVADHAPALRERFLVVDLAPALARALCSKKELHHLARRIGIPTAQAVFPRSREDVLAFLEDATLPVMLKGIDGLRLQRSAGERMFIVRTREELLAKYDAFETPADPNLMLQEYIPGGDDTVWMFNGYFDARSECPIGFTGKKLRQHPVARGCTSLGICLRNEVVESTTKRFMKAIGYQGILDIGYRYDARDGTYKVLDVNPRIGATFRLFVADNGMDVARALYLDMTGHPILPSRAREGRRWIVEDLDLASSFRYWRDGGLTLRPWLRSFAGIEEAAYLAWDDPLPLLPMCARDGGKLVRGLVGRARVRWRARRATRGRRAPVRDLRARPAPGRAAGIALD